MEEILKTDMDFEEKGDYIIENIGLQAFFEQMAEECCELGQACLKLIRSFGNGNPTPVSLKDALVNFKEESHDVMLCTLLIMDPSEEQLMKKLDRWVKRVEEAKKEDERGEQED